MAQRSYSAGSAGRSQCPIGFDDPKTVDKRVNSEIKKVKDLLAACEKGKAQMEGERKAYCEEFKKYLVGYIADESIFTPTYVTGIQKIVLSLEELDQHYQTAIQHIQEATVPALAYLAKRFDTLKKPIKLAKQAPTEIPKIRDFEYERIENIKYALLHFFNAKMYLHAKALELLSRAYEQMRCLSVKNEFRKSDIQTLRQVLAANPHIYITPRGGGGTTSNSARQSSQNSARGTGQEAPGRAGGQMQPARGQSNGSAGQRERPVSAAEAQKLQARQQQRTR